MAIVAQAVEASRLAALHHSMDAQQRRRRRPISQRMSHSLSDSFLTRKSSSSRRIGDASADSADSLQTGCHHQEDDAGKDQGGVAAAPAPAPERSRGWLRSLTRGRRRQSASTSHIPDPASTLGPEQQAPPSGDRPPILLAKKRPPPLKRTSSLDRRVACIQAAFRGFSCRHTNVNCIIIQKRREQRQTADTTPSEPPPVSVCTPPKASEEERASMYRELSSSYTPSRSPGLGAVPLASTLSDGAEPEPEPAPMVELVLTEAGEVRPSVGLNFAFVTSAEKISLMNVSEEAALEAGVEIVRARRRSSSSSAVIELVEGEVEKVVANRRAPAPKRMAKPKRRSSGVDVLPSTPEAREKERSASEADARLTLQPMGAASPQKAAASAGPASPDGAIPRVSEMRNLGTEDTL